MTTTEIYQSQAEEKYSSDFYRDGVQAAYVRACTDMEKVAIAYGEYVEDGISNLKFRKTFDGYIIFPKSQNPFIWTSQQLFENFIKNIYKP